MNDFTNEERFQRQLEFEDVRKLRAVQKFRKDLHRMRYELTGGYLSGTDVGRFVTSDIVTTLAPKFHQMLEEQPQFKAKNRNAVDAQLICKLLGVECVLGIAIKGFIDACGRETQLEATKVISTAAARLQTEWCRSRWEQLDPDAIGWLEKRYKLAGTWHKMRAASVILRNSTGESAGDLKAEVPRIAFFCAAAWVLDCIQEHTGWFTKELRWVSKNKSKTFIKLSPLFEAWYQQQNEHIESQLQQLYPMLCPPANWDLNGEHGGYLNPVGRVSRLVKTEKGEGSQVSPAQLGLINGALQSTAWEINPFVFEVQNTLFGTPGVAIGSFKPISFHPLTNEPMPDHIDALPTDHPDRVAWRKEKAAINTANSESRREGIRTVRNVSAARLYATEDKFWCPWSLGHNGRAYVLSGGALSPQGPDAERALLRFAEGAEMTERAEYHLTVNLANLYGISESHEAKQQWVQDNLELITAIATNPLDTIAQWEVADEPWQFIAACDEYYRCVITKTDRFTKLPVFNDATASGIQILALLSRDKDAAEKVNLIPGKQQKQDVYAALKPLLREELSAVADEYGKPHLVDLWLPRKAYKSNLVSRIYGSVLRSRKKALTAATLEAHNWDLNLLHTGDAQVLAECMERAMQRLAPGALSLFDNLQKLGHECAKNGVPAVWTTPAGNRVVVNPRKHPIKRFSLGWFGWINIADDTKEPVLDPAKVRRSTAPLLVHSLDAATLTVAFEDWRRPLTSCHDCIGVRATDCDEALERMLNGYITVLKDGQEFLKQVAEENNVNISWNFQNTLTDADIKNITQCQYAFC